MRLTKYYLLLTWYWLVYKMGGTQVLLSHPCWTAEPLSDEDLNNF